MNAKEPVKLRKKKMKNGGYSLYLDYYVNGKRSFEFLKLYLNPSTDLATKQKNKHTLEVAKVLQAKRLIQYQENRAGIIGTDKRNMLMSEWMDKVIEQKSDLDKNYLDCLRNVRRIWTQYAGEVRVADIDADMIRGYIKLLKKLTNTELRSRLNEKTTEELPSTEALVKKVHEMHECGASDRLISRETNIARSTISKILRRPRNTEHLSDVTQRIYYDRLGTFLNKAVKAGIITFNPMNQLDTTEKPKAAHGHREYLTFEELEILARTPVKYESAKRMFMFSCFTGLRYSDVIALKWEMVDSGTLTIKQEKTDRMVSVPLSSNARMWLPDRNGDLVFSEHPCLSTIDRYIKVWMKDAGIHKNISYHCSRHTFATLLITSGADIYVTSSLLGHSSVNVTEIYAKVVDDKKEKAISLIPEMK